MSRIKRVSLERAVSIEEEKKSLSKGEQEVQRRSKRVSIEGSRRC